MYMSFNMCERKSVREPYFNNSNKIINQSTMKNSPK